MRFVLCLGVALAFALAPGPTLGQTVRPEGRTVGKGCTMMFMCVGQSVIGDCDDVGNGTGDVIIAEVPSRSNLTFHANQSTAGTFECDFMANDRDSTAGAFQINAPGDELTQVQRMISIVAPFEYVYMNCASITGGGNVVVNMLVCPLER